MRPTRSATTATENPQRGGVGRRDVSLPVEIEDPERRPEDDEEHAEHAEQRDDDAVRRRDSPSVEAHRHGERPV
jgi:hypothetical protein